MYPSSVFFTACFAGVVQGMAILPLQFLEGPGSPPSAQTVSQEAPRPTRTLPLYIYSHHPVASPSDNSVVIKQSGSIEVEPPTRTLAQNLARPTAAQRNAPAKMNRRQDAPSGTTPPNMSPTPAPTGSSSPDTTVYITDEKNFALMLPKNPGEMISDAESDGVAFCAPGNADCTNKLPDGFITAAAFSKSPDNAWVQVTGCLDSSKFHFAAEDHGGQFDVRFPNGAQCTFGGYAASFIELVEPVANRFCIRCCSAENDQTNCNSHRDRDGCPNAIPGTYDFPQVGVSCSG